MAEIFVGVGSNIRPHEHVARALAAMTREFGELRTSTVYRCPPVGFEGNDFLNLVVAFESAEPPEAITETLHRIEGECGRDRDAPRFAPRTVDLDLLLYGDRIVDRPGLRLPRAEILEYPFVLKPLAELAGDRPHPETGRTLEAHWQAFDGPVALTPTRLAP